MDDRTKDVLDVVENFLAEHSDAGGLVITFGDEPKDEPITFTPLHSPYIPYRAYTHRMPMACAGLGSSRHEAQLNLIDCLGDFDWPEKMAIYRPDNDKKKDWEASDFIPVSKNNEVCQKVLTNKELDKRKRQRKARKKARK